jgi:DNA-directed RNA polymerase subunit alpha
MYFLQEHIGEPSITVISKKGNILTIEIAPLPTGYGVTVGNSMRRVLLSSIKGSAVTAIKVKGATHEFMTLEGVKDSILDIILNIRTLRIKKEDSEKALIRLHVKGKDGAVTATDIHCPAGIEIINSDQYITEVSSKDIELDIEMTVEDGYGFSPASERKGLEANQIAIDALFSPVKKVKYNVTQSRVGDIIDLDKLEMDIETDGTIDAHEAVKNSANTLKYYFGLFDDASDEAVKALRGKIHRPEDETATDANPAGGDDDSTFTPIEILAFSSRTLNALINNDITSIERLEKISKKHLLTLKGFGKKALAEVDIALKNMGKSLREK